MINLLKITFLSFLVISLCACSQNDLDSLRKDFLEPINLWRPRPIGMGDVDPNAPPDYKQGWNDGCDSGLAAYGGSTYTWTGYKFKQDYTQLDNQEYYGAWQQGWLYCRWYVWNYIVKQETGELSPF